MASVEMVPDRKAPGGFRPRKGPQGRKIAFEPSNPTLILKIIDLRDRENMRWRRIGDELGLSHQAPYLLYKKWRDWAYAQDIKKGYKYGPS
jgi:hypothetical protein